LWIIADACPHMGAQRSSHRPPARSRSRAARKALPPQSATLKPRGKAKAADKPAEPKAKAKRGRPKKTIVEEPEEEEEEGEAEEEEPAEEEQVRMVIAQQCLRLLFTGWWVPRRSHQGPVLACLPQT
jgi:hypothetical protein